MSSSSLPSLLVFGPQTSWPTSDYLSHLRHSLLLEPRLRELLSAIRALPTLFEDLQSHDHRLGDTSGARDLQDLQAWIDHGVFPGVTRTNILSMPLTVVIHLVQYFHYLDNNSQGLTHSQIHEAVQSGGIQGFCVGLLSSITVACSETEADISKFGAVALRLATIMGAYVDLDAVLRFETAVVLAVRWNSQGGHNIITEILKDHENSYISVIRDATDINITAPKASAALISQLLSSQNITVKSTGLEGNCHSSANQDALEKILSFCESSPGMVFPAAKPLAPIRSNFDAQPLQEGQLHKVSLKCTLVDLANWHLTMVTAVAQLVPMVHPVAVSFGLVDCIPGSVLRESGLEVVKWRHAKLTTERLDLGADLALQSGSTTPEELRSEPSQYPENAIAIIGMACKFPGADSLEEFWDILAAGDSMCQEMPADRFSTQGLRRSKDGKLKFWGNFVKDAESFDHKFFKKSSREAASMDPQQRSLLEVAYAAMESSGYFGRSTDSPADVGVYLGACSSDYNDNVASHNPNAFSSLGTLRAFLSGRISHYFNWTGPSIVYDTACSSSAVAIHAACKALQLGECTQALAGGVSLYTSPNFYQNLAAASFLSPTGPTKPFDSKADGYCRGEGTGIVVLKKLSAALEDGDNVLSVIVGSAVNQNQNCTYITVPHGGSQQALYQKVVAEAQLAPTDISYVEAHGTGTPVGDPIEFASIREVFGSTDRRDLLSVASVKGNIGHLEGAAGIAALIKVVLMLQKQQIPVQANFHTLNPSIAPLAIDKMEIPTKTRPWLADFKAACVNNYGAAGSNAAIVIREPPVAHSLSQGKALDVIHVPSKHPIYISANSPSSLSNYCTALLSQIKRLSASTEDRVMEDIAYNLAVKQNRSLGYTLATTVSDLNELRAVLTSGAAGATSLIKQSDDQPRKPVVLCFGGQVRDFVGLDKLLFDAYPILRSHLEHCDLVLRSSGLPGLFPQIFQTTTIEDVIQLHGMLFSLQYSCARSWIDSGLQVDAVIGHSFGQLTALCISGSLSLEDTVKLICGRASLMKSKWGPERGAMISVESDIDSVLSIAASKEIAGAGHKIEIACYNSPTSHVLVGTKAAIDQVESGLLSSKTRHKRLQVTHGFHSQFTAPLLPELLELSGKLTLKEPVISLETCSAEMSWKEPSAQLIGEHTRTPVYFSQAVARLAERLGPCTWLEAGSSSSITNMVRRALGVPNDSKNVFLPVTLGASDASTHLSDTVATLWRAGYRTVYWGHHRDLKYSYMNLPPYQFEKHKHWLEWKDTAVESPRPAIESQPSGKPVILSLSSSQGGNGREAEFNIDPSSEEYTIYVKGHAVLAEPLCPAPLYMELVSRAVSILEPESAASRQPSIQELTIMTPLGVDPNRKVTLALKRVDDVKSAWQFEFFSNPLGAASPTAGRLSHAVGTVALELSDQQTDTDFSRYGRLLDYQRLLDIQEDFATEAMQGSLIYKVFEKVVTYAPYYKGVRRIFSKGRQVTATVSLPSHDLPLLANTHTNPLAIDNIFQVAGLQVNAMNECRPGDVFVCTKVDSIRISPKFRSGLSWAVYSSFSPIGEREIINDIFAFDTADKNIVMMALGARFTRVSISSLTKVLSRANGSISAPALAASPISLDQASSTRQTVKQPRKVKVRLPTKKSSAKPTTGNDVFKLLSKVSDLPVSDIKEDSTLEDLGIDSLMVMEVLSEVQNFFNIEIPNADWQTLETPKLLTAYLISRGCGHGTEPRTPSDSDLSSIVDSDSETSLDSDLNTTPGSSNSLSKHHRQAASIPLDYFEHVNALATATTPDQKQTAVIQNAQGAFQDIRLDYDIYTKQTGFADFWKQVYPAQARLVLSYTVEAFRSLGCDLSSLRFGTILPGITYLPRHELLVKQLYEVLADGLLISIDGTKYTRTEFPIDTVPSTVLFQDILTAFPQHANEHRLLNITGSKLGPCLEGTADPLKLLFADKANKDLLADVYTRGPMYGAITMLLGKFLVKALTAKNQGEVFHILELGGGTGGTTKHIIELLTEQGIPFTYTFTDISSSLVAAARRRFKDRSNMEFMVIDIEKVPAEKHLEKYHVVLSTNCIHATRNLTESGTNIKSLLRPDGFLSLVEFTRNMFWFDLVFGLLDGWWLFNDGRKHVLADQWFWDKSLRTAGFKHVTWTDGDSAEARTLRIITAFPAEIEDVSFKIRRPLKSGRADVQTVQWKQSQNCKLMADIYFPPLEEVTARKRPIAILVHGGGSIMFTRKEVHPKQVKLLLDAGFLPISVEYRFCPEINILDGAMTDVCDALEWARNVVPTLELDCPGLKADGETVVVVGWSTGGHLSMTTAFTTKQRGFKPPAAILAFYCPTDYESDWWRHPIYPLPAVQKPDTPYDLLEGVQEEPLSSYYPSTNRNYPGMLMSLDDPRWRFVLHMNWRAQTLPTLIHGLPSRAQLQQRGQAEADVYSRPMPSAAQIASISPFAQINRGAYDTPTFLIHGTADDLIPWQHSQRVVDALRERGVDCGIEVLEGVGHLFDTFTTAGEAEIGRGYKWLAERVFGQK